MTQVNDFFVVVGVVAKKAKLNYERLFRLLFLLRAFLSLSLFFTEFLIMAIIKIILNVIFYLILKNNHFFETNETEMRVNKKKVVAIFKYKSQKKRSFRSKI